MASNNARTILWKSLALACGYSVFWAALNFFVVTTRVELEWLPVQLSSSILIYFCFNGLFITFDYYRWGRAAQVFASILYVQPFFQLEYFQTYRSFLDQQNISLVIREPFFLLKIFTLELTATRAAVFILGVLFCWWLNEKVLRREHPVDREHRPYDFFFHPWSLVFTAAMIFLQIKWCLGMDPSQLLMRPMYPVTVMALISTVIFLWQTRAPAWEKSAVVFLLVANIFQLYAFNWGLLNLRGRFNLDQQYYRALFGAYYVQMAFNDMSENDDAKERFRALPLPALDYNILLILNDAQRWDHLSSHGYPEPTDAELDWFTKQAFDFRYPISTANFTDTAVPALVTGLASDQDVRKIKSYLPFWDYYAKGAATFFISTQDVTWSKLDRLYLSFGQQHLWSATAQPDFDGHSEDAIDQASLGHMLSYLPTLKRPWVGVWQTYASHYPYLVPPEFTRFLPCDPTRESGTEALRNCYLNGQFYSSHVRDQLLRKADLANTVVVMTSDHGEGLGEHGVFYHGADYHQEMVKVPFVIYLPPRILARLPPEAIANLRANTKKVISTVDLVPTLLHLHEMLTGLKLAGDLDEFSGRSLFTKWDHRVIFSSHCFPQYRCYSREILFADDNYSVIFRPSEGFYKIYDTWKDPWETHPIEFRDVDPAKFEALVNGAAEVHDFGRAMKAYYERVKQNGEKPL